MSTQSSLPIQQTPETPVGQTHEIVQESDFVPRRKIVVCIDGSDDALYAVNWAVQHIIKPDDQLVLLNARPIPFSSTLAYADYSGLESMEEFNKYESHRLLSTTAKSIKGVHIRAISLRGNVRQELLHAIEKIKPTMVVIGHKGMGKVKRALMGSISEYLVHHLEVPVMVTKRQ